MAIILFLKNDFNSDVFAVERDKGLESIVNNIYQTYGNNDLYKNDKKVIDDNTLTATTLLIAESNPKEKEIIIDLVMNFLVN